MIKKETNTAIREICNREVVVVTRATSAAEAAKLMRQQHVVDLVVAMKEGDCVPPLIFLLTTISWLKQSLPVLILRPLPWAKS